jgi:hypothetical protein
MSALLIIIGAMVCLGFVTKFLIGRNRTRELDRDFSIEVSCTRERALMVAANAARGVLWHMEFTENGLRTRHIRANNIVHVAVSDHARTGRCTVKVWTRYRWADTVLFLRPQSYLDTRRKRDKIIRMLSEYAPADRDATIG